MDVCPQLFNIILGEERILKFIIMEPLLREQEHFAYGDHCSCLLMIYFPEDQG
jgi:hypothetical protein